MTMLGAAFTLAGLLGATAATPATAQEPKSDVPAAIVVEHAEVVPKSSDRYEGYLSVWNGTDASIEVIGVESELFDSVTIRRTLFEQGVAGMPVVSAAISIPSQSELAMKPEGIHLRLEGAKRGIGLGTEIPVTVRLSDGTSQTIKAVMVPASSEITDHHHGGKDGLEGG